MIVSWSFVQVNVWWNVTISYRMNCNSHVSTVLCVPRSPEVLIWALPVPGENFCCFHQLEKPLEMPTGVASAHESNGEPLSQCVVLTSLFLCLLSALPTMLQIHRLLYLSYIVGSWIFFLYPSDYCVSKALLGLDLVQGLAQMLPSQTLSDFLGRSSLPTRGIRSLPHFTCFAAYLMTCSVICKILICFYVVCSLLPLECKP